MKFIKLSSAFVIVAGLGGCVTTEMTADAKPQNQSAKVKRSGHASWYGKKFNKRPMANGVLFNNQEPTVAHKTLPLNTCVEVFNPATGKAVQAMVTDRGPYIPDRSIDVSEKLADNLGFKNQGVAYVSYSSIPCPPNLMRFSSRH